MTHRLGWNAKLFPYSKIAITTVDNHFCSVPSIHSLPLYHANNQFTTSHPHIANDYHKYHSNITQNITKNIYLSLFLSGPLTASLSYIIIRIRNHLEWYWALSPFLHSTIDVIAIPWAVWNTKIRYQLQGAPHYAVLVHLALTKPASDIKWLRSQRSLLQNRYMLHDR